MLPAHRFVAAALLLVGACGEGDGGTATTTNASQSSTQASTSPATGDSGSSEGPACTQYLDTFEPCGFNGCAAGPTILDGIASTGSPCTMAAECAPTRCTCPNDANVQWFAASCGCDECADEEIACLRTRSLVACM